MTLQGANDTLSGNGDNIVVGSGTNVILNGADDGITMGGGDALDANGAGNAIYRASTMQHRALNSPAARRKEKQVEPQRHKED